MKPLECCSPKAFGVVQSIDLKPGGSEIEVTNDNKEEYVKLVCERRMVGCCREQLDNFVAGIEFVCFVTSTNLHGVCDIISAESRTGPYNTMVNRRRLIAIHYIQSWFSMLCSHSFTATQIASVHSHLTHHWFLASPLLTAVHGVWCPSRVSRGCATHAAAQIQV